MSEEIEEELSSEAERARNALHRIPPPRAETAFRDRLKREFVSGAIEVTAAPEGKGRRRGDRGRREAVRPFPIHARGRRSATWIAVAAGLAAALLLVVGTMNRGPTWRVTAARGEGTVQVDGDLVSLDDRDAMRKLFVPGAEIDVQGNAEIDLSCGQVVALQLTPGTRMTLPPPPGRWFDRRSEVYVRAGELRVATGSGFPGAQFAIVSPTAAVEVKGTTFAVIIEDQGTCVCVLEGMAVVGRLRGGEQSDMVPVPGGMRRYVYRDGRLDPLHEMREEEQGKLAQFRESQHPWLEGAGTPETSNSR